MGRTHLVNQGECLSSLAKRFGFLDYRTIYDHPRNAELRKKRPNPNVVFPGDAVFIPDRELQESAGETEETHEFQLIAQTTLFRLIVKDSEEKPYADTRYELKIDRKSFQGKTDGAGKLEELIPADARAGTLLLFKGTEENREMVGLLSLKLGHLDPVEEMTGVQSRLNNLGFACGRADGRLGKKTKEALRDFQEKNGLTVTGEADAATREKLRELHDWS